ncbi:MAG: hypothetical protein PHT21_11005 [Lachnospiraceae bacterium]|nr:hypothetical protein [Lachnospiraceae bacterium]
MEEVQLQKAELFIKENEPILTQPEAIADPVEIIKDNSLDFYTDVQNKSSFESVITVIEYTIWLLLALVIVAYFGIWNRNRIRIYYKNERGGYTFIGRSNFTEEEGLRTLIIKDYLTERSKSTEYMIIIPAYIMKYSKRKDLLIKNYKSHIYTCISERVYFQLQG